MAYCDTTDVQALLPQFTLSTTTKPTLVQTGLFIDDIAAEMDIYLARGGVTTPVTTPTTFTTWLKKVNAEGAAATVLRGMFPGQMQNANQVSSPADMWEARYKAALKLIQDQKFLSSITGSGDDLQVPTTYLTNNPDEEEDIGEIAEPFFKLGHTF